MAKPDLQTLISVQEFEKVASQEYDPKTWAFYSSAATDLVTYKYNARIFQDVMIRPRFLRNVRNVNIKRSILGFSSAAPFFVSPTAMNGLAHPEGEKAIARACAAEGIVQVISTNASHPLRDIVSATKPGHIFFFQLYVNSDRSKTVELLRTARDLGAKAIVLTIDAPVPGKREADERIPAGNVKSGVSGAVAVNDNKGGGLGRVMGAYVDSTVVWEDIAWIKATSQLPVILKGVQTAADARKAMEVGASGIILSNHGGRSLDTCQPAMLCLMEIHKQSPEVFDQIEVYLDGGVTRGTDILKALALGATAVGIGRPFLYSLAYGEQGARHMTGILKDELENSLRLCGVTDVDALHPGLLNTAAIDHLVCDRESHDWIKWRPKAMI